MLIDFEMVCLPWQPEDEDIDPNDDGSAVSAMLQSDDGEDEGAYLEIELPSMEAGSAEQQEQMRVAKMFFKVGFCRHANSSLIQLFF
jgi:hypothetical protein